MTAARPRRRPCRYAELLELARAKNPQKSSRRSRRRRAAFNRGALDMTPALAGATTYFVGSLGDGQLVLLGAFVLNRSASSAYRFSIGEGFWTDAGSMAWRWDRWGCLLRRRELLFIRGHDGPSGEK